MSKQPAIFLDRDGTLIEDRGYLTDSSQVSFYPQTVSALRRLHQHFSLFIVTNQGGISQGLLTLEQATAVNQFVVDALAAEGVSIAGVYVCPHGKPLECHCRKPKPFFAHEAARQHNLDLARSFAIGDHPHDVTFAENFGGAGIYVMTGHGCKHAPELAAGVRIAADIHEAAELILG
jgi:histidinol-phosphate phosphatase family protein